MWIKTYCKKKTRLKAISLHDYFEYFIYESIQTGTGTGERNPELAGQNHQKIRDKLQEYLTKAKEKYVNKNVLQKKTRLRRTG